MSSQPRPPEVLTPDRPTQVAQHLQDLDIEPEPQPLATIPRPADIDPPPQPRALRDVSPTRPAIADSVSIVKFSDEVGELFGALAEAQGKFAEVEKTLKAKVQSRKEGGANYEYEYETLADVLDAIRKPMSDAGIAVMQFPSLRTGNTMLIRTMLGHRSGQWMYNDLTATIVGTDPQAVGGGISYLRRYALKAIVAVAAGVDDDGEAASRPRPPQQPPPQAAPRRSQQPPPAPAAAVTPPAAPVAAADTPNIGTIRELGERGGAWFVMLDTGYKCATKDKDLATALIKHKSVKARLELICKKPNDPKYAPTIEEIRVIPSIATGGEAQA